MKGNPYKLNAEQKAFCEYYIQTRNATRSYEKAYGTDLGKEMNYNNCASSSSKLLKTDKIQNYIGSRLKELDVERMLDSKEIIMELNRIALEPAHKPSDRLKALEMLGRANAMFTDVNKQEGDLNFKINIKSPEQDSNKQTE